jgi:hypothetical protein
VAARRAEHAEGLTMDAMTMIDLVLFLAMVVALVVIPAARKA